MIPKVIHYCWFGKGSIPEEYQTYIESWKIFCPDYEIKKWDEDNFDFQSCAYVEEAYEAQKWAFVSDYARFKILYENGGIYFDTDVEMIKSIGPIAEKGPFMCCEKNWISDNSIAVAPGLGLGTEPCHAVYKEILDYYQTLHFIKEDGTANEETVVKYVTQILKKHGLKQEKQMQCVAGITIYPPEYFCPMNYDSSALLITDNTYTIHHYGMSWLNCKEKRRNCRKRWFCQRLGADYGRKVFRVYDLPYRIRQKIKEQGIKETLIFTVKKIRNFTGGRLWIS